MVKEQGEKPPIRPGEQDIVVFVSSVMNASLQWARESAVKAVDKISFFIGWAFEYTPASSEEVDEGYLRKVRESDFVLWLVGKETTEPVKKEIHEALSNKNRILAFKLPVNQRDEETELLISEVGSDAKWMPINSVEELENGIKLAFSDEFIRILRNKPSFGRTAQLEEMKRASIARCKARWRAAGVLEEDAQELALDPEVGTPTEQMKPSQDKPFIILIGELGTGKSLLIERLYQDSLGQYYDNTAKPIPVFLDAKLIDGPLQSVAIEASSGLGSPRSQGVALFIDGADEGVIGGIGKLVHEARILIGTWQNTSVVIASRPIGSLEEEEEAIFIENILEDQAYALISRIAGTKVTIAISHNWSSSIREAVHRPLFAVLLGTYLRRNRHAPNSSGELITNLVEKVLLEKVEQPERAKELLMKLAMMILDRGGGNVLGIEFGFSQEIEPLVRSGLVVEYPSKALNFSLAIFTEWFGAQNIAARTLDATEIVSDYGRLQNWLYPLIIFTNIFSHNQVSETIGGLVKRYPGTASTVMHEAFTKLNYIENAALPTWRECGERIRETMNAWAEGIGSLASLIAPMRGSSILPLAIRIDEGQIWWSWYYGEDEVEEIMPFKPGAMPPPLFPTISWNTPCPQSAWAWQFSFEILVGNLSRIIKNRALPIRGGFLTIEATWEYAINLLGKGSLFPGPIPLDEMGEALSRFTDDIDLVKTNGKYILLSPLREQVKELRKEGLSEIVSPLPGPDKDFSGGYVWNLYSKEQLLKRTRAIYKFALEGYNQIIAQWFLPLAPNMNTYILQPAKFVGGLVYGDEQFGPALEWFLQPLPSDHGSFVDIDYKEGFSPDEFLETNIDALLSLRPNATIFQVNQVLDIWGSSPVAEIVYKWLWNDLKRMHYVK